MRETSAAAGTATNRSSSASIEADWAAVVVLSAALSVEESRWMAVMTSQGIEYPSTGAAQAVGELRPPVVPLFRSRRNRLRLLRLPPVGGPDQSRPRRRGR